MTPTQQQVLDPRSAIAETNRRFMASFARQDAASIATLYTEEGQVLPPGGDPIQGKSGIQQFWQGAMDLGIREAVLETLEIDTQGTQAIEIGRYALAGEGGAAIDRGKYLVVWRQQGDAWKLHKDIWNTSVPQAG